MSLTYKVNAVAGDFEPVPAGSHIAVCDIVADIGLQPGSGMYPQPKNQVYIRFELPNERIQFEKDGKKQEGPQVIGKTYTASMNEKANLRHHLESWRGKAFTDEEAESFDVSAILGKPCMLTVMHTKKGEKTYANITSIGPLPKGIQAKTIIPEITPVLYASLDDTASYTAEEDRQSESCRSKARDNDERNAAVRSLRFNRNHGLRHPLLKTF